MPVEPLPLRFGSGRFIAALTLALVAAACSDSAGGTATGGGGSGGGLSTSGSGGANSVGGTAPQGGINATAGANMTAGADATAGGNAGGGTGGAGGAAGAASGGAAGAKGNTLPPACKVDMLWTGSPTRPQLTDDAAACFTVLNALAAAGNTAHLVTDDWDPTAGLAEAGTLTPKFTVAADDSGTHKTVQAAIDAATAAGGTDRVNILVKPGTYRGPVCVKGTVPITLYGADADATKVSIAFDNYSGKTVPLGDATQTNPCKLPSKATFGTSDSTTLWVSSDGFQAMNLTFANDFVEPDSGTFQAVALSTTGDKLVFQNVRVLGNQDTLQPSSATSATVARAYYKKSYVEGDTDFIFGRGVAVFDDCDIAYVGTRKSNGASFAPSTDGAAPYGFLVINSRIVAGTGAVTGAAGLGRAWDVSSEPNSNGETIVVNSKIDNHVSLAAPWKASTSGRVFNATTNRLFEYKNTGAGAAP